MARNSNGRLKVFIVGTNNALYYKSQTAAGSSSWSGWTSLGGGINDNTTSPAMTVNGDGRLRVFVIGTNNQVYHKSSK